MTCTLFREHFIALFAQSNCICFFFVKLKKHLTFSRFFFVQFGFKCGFYSSSTFDSIWGVFYWNSVVVALLDGSHFD